MENYGRGSIHQLVCWNRFYENPRFNENVKEARLNMERIKQLDSTYGRHSKHRRLPGPNKAQATNFRLTPLLALQETQTEHQRDQNPITCAADECAWTSAKSGDYFVPMYLTRASLRQGRPTCTAKPSLEDVRISTPSSLCSPLPGHPSDTSWNSSGRSTPLSVFARRPPTDQLLYRRPTISKAIALITDEELFTKLANEIDLRPIPFKKTTDAYKFYQTKFPLLLTTVDKERCTTPSKRSSSPESPMHVMIARRRLLNQRLVDQECMMVDMERATEDDVKFVTELHDPVFDPTTWPWNKIDVQGTIDASLQEMSNKRRSQSK